MNYFKEKTIRLWLDDIRPNPEGYVWLKSVNQAKDYIITKEYQFKETFGTLTIEIDIDHDAGEYFNDGGDYIKLLDWLETTERNCHIHIHSMNVVGVENMRRIIKRNHWKEL